MSGAFQSSIMKPDIIPFICKSMLAEAKFAYEMKYAISYVATLDAPQVIGPVAEGLRLNVL